MKKILVYGFATVLSCDVIAQSKMAKMDSKPMKMESCVMMKGGKMMCEINGKTTAMTKAMPAGQDLQS